MQQQYPQVPLRDIKIPKKQNLGFAYLEINSDEGYQLLLKQRFLSIKGRNVLMKPFEKGSNLGKFKNDVTLRRLYVYSLPQSMTNDSLFQLFSQFGTVEDAYIIFDNVTKKSKLFGYVIYETVQEAQSVI